jgi:DNA-binding CsgD family transcriptional regulator
MEVLALYSAATLNRFIQQAFPILSRIVPCDYVSAIYRRAGDGFLKERDSRGRIWGRAFMRRYVELTPAVALVAANPGVKILATRSAITLPEAELRRTALFREVMRPQGWRHGAVLCFWADPPESFPIFVLALYRGADRPDFSDDELSRLADVHPFLSPMVNRLHELSSSAAFSAGVDTALRHVIPGVVILDWRLRILRANLAGRRSCAAWHPRSPGERVRRGGAVQVPAALVHACNELRLELQSLMRKHPDSTAQRRRVVCDPNAPGLTASVTATCQATAIAEPSFVIEFLEPEPSSAMVTATQTLASLTEAEREVAVIVARGVSNDEAAERLGKTIHAVKFLLHRVYRKLRVPNRARLALLLRPHADS